MTENAKQIKALISQLHDLMAEEEGWEPKTPRDYGVLTWAAIQEMRGEVSRLKGLYDRVTRLESNQSILALIQGTFTILAATVAGLFGPRR